MKVNPTSSPKVETSSTSGSKKSEKVKSSVYEAKPEVSPSVMSNGSVKAEISSKAKDMATAKLIASATETDPSREAKIAELKEKIQNKTYNVSANEISDKLVDDHLSLVGA